MPRPLKKGLDYFPTDCNMDEDYKFFDLFDDIGTAKGIGVIMLILSSIYKGEGYFMRWDNSICRKFSRKKQVEKEDIETAIEILTGTSKKYFCDDEPFFNTALYRSDKILTSKGIQKRFFLGAERRKERKIFKNYFLLDYDNGEIQVGTSMIDGKRKPVMEKSNYITIEKKQISFDFIVSALIPHNVNINKVNANINSINAEDIKINNPELVNVNINGVNEYKSTQTKEEQTKLKQTKTEQTKEEKSNSGNSFRKQKLPPPPDFTESLPEIIESIRLHWNTKTNLPEEPFSMVNNSHGSDILESVNTLGKDKIVKGIDNLDKYYLQEEMPPQSFSSFLDPKKIVRWLDSSKPGLRYKKSKPIFENDDRKF